MKSAKTIVIVAAVLFAALSLSVHSAERQDSTPARVTPPRTPTRPAQILEEEAPIPKPVTRTPTRATTPRTPSRRPPTRPTPVRRVRPPVDPHKDSVILVEAFMVEVRLSALYSLGVPQISEGCNSVSAEHIIKLMKTTDAAVVTAGAKVAVSQNSKANTKSTTRQSILSGPPEKKRTEYVEVGTSFTAFAIIRPGQKIFVELDFEHSTVQPASPNTKESRIVKRTWDSYVYLKAGKPTLVGSTQDKETGTFLIVTANIKE